MRNQKHIYEVVSHSLGEIEVGKFTLRKFDDEKFWLVNADGEGMETSEEEIEKLLAKFFKKMF